MGALLDSKGLLHKLCNLLILVWLAIGASGLQDDVVEFCDDLDWKPGPGTPEPFAPFETDPTETEFEHVVRVSNSQELAGALLNLTNSTHLILVAGEYTLPGAHQAPGAFWLRNVREVTIEGECDEADAFGNCLIAGTALRCPGSGEKGGDGGGQGLAFLESSNIVLVNLSMTSCGALHWSTSWSNSTGQLPMLVAMLFARCQNVTLHGVQVVYSHGAGAFLLDVYGQVQVSSCLFANNVAVDMSRYLSAATNVSSPVFGGGGLLVEFPYCVLPVMLNASRATKTIFMPPCDYMGESNWAENQDRAKYILTNNTFKENLGVSYNYKTYTFIRPGGQFHQAFGRGGGLSIFVKGDAHHSNFQIHQCTFLDNTAAWGAGFFLEMQDNVTHTNMNVTACHLEGNNATQAGGGSRIGFIFLENNSTHGHNLVHFFDCGFLNNTAAWGGGFSAYAGAEPKLYPTNKLLFKSCRWWKNSAISAAAVGLNRWHYVTPGAVISPVFEGCTFRENTMLRSQIVGRGTVLVDMLSLSFIGGNCFCFNEGSALVLDSSSATMDDRVNFHNNTGDTGGAVMMSGFSWITLDADAHLSFQRNSAQMYGGAIFCETNSAHSVLSSRNCFLQYHDQTASPDDWTATVTFEANYAAASGNSVYATTLYHCLWGGNTQGSYPSEEQMQRVLNWTSFHYISGGYAGYEIATTANELIGPSSRVELSPGEHRSITIKARDDLNQTAETVVFVSLSSAPHADDNITVGDDRYRTISKDKMSPIWLDGEPHLNGTLNLRTMGSRPVSSSIEIGTDYCYACYEYNPHQKQCVCLSEGDTTAVSRCNDTNYGCYLQNGYWGGFLRNESVSASDSVYPLVFVTVPCPFDYCKCDRNGGATFSECTLNHSTVDETRDSWGIYLNSQCLPNRVGRLCGKCRDGMSVLMGSNECAYCDNSGVARIWGCFVVIGVILTLFMIRVDFNILSGHVSSSWFYFQVLPYILSDNASFKFTTIYPFNIIMNLVNFSLPFSTCFYDGMDDLDKLAAGYAVPAYILLVVLVMAYLSRFPRIQRVLLCGCNQEQPPSLLKTLISLLAIFYVSLVANSFQLLAFTRIEGTGPWLFRDANVALWGRRHAPWGGLAVLIITFIAVPVPIFFLCAPRLQRRYPLARLKPLLDVVQAPYATNRRSFAGYYFLIRLVILIVTSSEILPLPVRQVVLQLICLLIVVVHMLARPYGGRLLWLNHVDTVILTSLAATTQVNFFYGTRSDSGETTEWAATVVKVLMYIPLLYLLVFVFGWIFIHLAGKAKSLGLLKRNVPTFQHLEQSLSSSTASVAPHVSSSMEASYDDDVASILWAASSSGRGKHHPESGPTLSGTHQRGVSHVGERCPLINSVGDGYEDEERQDRDYSSFAESGESRERNTNSSHGYVSSSTIGSIASRRTLDRGFDSNHSVQRRAEHDSGRG